MNITFYKDPKFVNFSQALFDFNMVEEIYNAGKEFPKGRGSSRIVNIEGNFYLLKKEQRGGISSKFLPKGFFGLSKFNAEIEMVAFLNDKGLTFPILFRIAKRKNFLFTIFTLTDYINKITSLKEVVKCDFDVKNKVVLAGMTIGKMHNLGFYHGDLNLGNVVFYDNECKIIDFKNSYFYQSPLKIHLSIKNLMRLLRSYYKEAPSLNFKKGAEFEDCLLQGYLKERENVKKEFLKFWASPLNEIKKNFYKLKNR